MKKLQPFILLVITLSILLYAAVKLLISDSGASRLRILSDTGTIMPGVHEVIVSNARNFPNLPDILTGSFPNIDTVSAKRLPGGILEIRITHKEIAAIWENNGKFYPLMASGEVIQKPISPDQSEMRNLILFSGDRPGNIVEIIEIIKAHPAIARRLLSVQFIEERRFNLNLLDRRVIKLPEENINSAIGQIQSSGILEKNWKVLDLRNPGRMIVAR